MRGRDSEVPLDLQRQIETLDDQASAGDGDIPTFVDALPAHRPETFPDGTASRSPASVYVHDQDAEDD